MKMPSSRRLALVLLLIAAGAGSYYYYQSDAASGGKPAAKAGKPATPVLVAKVTSRTVPVSINTIGTIQARATVSVRSRVDGQIMETAFTEGQLVAKGDHLFRIDPRPFQAKLRQAEANLTRDQAALDKAKSDFQRYQSLSDKGFSSQQKYEEARAAMNGLTATLRADQAAIDIAKLDLDFTTIRAPIGGRTGSVLVDAGNLVKANDAQPLVVINEIDPILATFSVPEAHLLEIKRRLADGSLAVEAAVPESNAPPIRGKLVFINNAVDTQTGTIQLKAEFANPGGLLTPGQFVRVGIEMEAVQNAPVVPERALQNGKDGLYVFLVKPDMTVEPVNVATGPTAEGFTVISQPLKVGDTVVTDGQLRLFKGAKVSFKDGKDKTMSDVGAGTKVTDAAQSDSDTTDKKGAPKKAAN